MKCYYDGVCIRGFKDLSPFCRSVLIACVASYFVLMGILTLYTTFKEKGIFAVAYQKEGTVSKTWQASSEMKK